MKSFDKGLAIVFFMGFLAMACAAGGPINFNDGTWSNCTYTKPDGTFFKAPVQLGGVPVGHGQPNGTTIDCVPIPESVE